MAPRHDPVRSQLSAYPFVHVVRARFADMDSYGHVNNVAVAAFYEDARVAFNGGLFGGLSPSRSGPIHFLIAQVTIHYLAEVNFPGEYRIGVGVTSVGRSSIAHALGLFRDDTCLGLCESVMVHMSQDGPAPVPPERRAGLDRLRFPVEGGT